ncbi:hypothetical protein CTI14_23830, partial [Methylobacterium radiotolerans]
MSSDVFPGPFGPMPEAGAAAILWMPPQADAPGPVRFVDGFGPFAEFARGQGATPQCSPSISGRRGTSSPVSPEVPRRATGWPRAAARFVGNVIAVVAPAGDVADDGRAGDRDQHPLDPGRGSRAGEVQQPEQRDALLQMLASWEQDDLDDQEMRALSAEDSAPAVVVPARAYVRPVLPLLDFHDESGDVIRYGHRWPDGIAPEESYSRESHPERFAPLPLVVDALVEHLRREYTVEVRREAGEGATERIVLAPARGAQIAITPGRSLRLRRRRRLFHAIVPSCISRCVRETAETAADELERIVLSHRRRGSGEYPVGRRAWP